jgi:hypothetical protein
MLSCLGHSFFSTYSVSTNNVPSTLECLPTCSLNFIEGVEQVNKICSILEHENTIEKNKRTERKKMQKRSAGDCISNRMGLWRRCKAPDTKVTIGFA